MAVLSQVNEAIHQGSLSIPPTPASRGLQDMRHEDRQMESTAYCCLTYRATHNSHRTSCWNTNKGLVYISSRNPHASVGHNYPSLFADANDRKDHDICRRLRQTHVASRGRFSRLSRALCTCYGVSWANGLGRLRTTIAGQVAGALRHGTYEDRQTVIFRRLGTLFWMLEALSPASPRTVKRNAPSISSSHRMNRYSSSVVGYSHESLRFNRTGLSLQRKALRASWLQTHCSRLEL
ncbi:hypothetical protein C8Q74DRAFT_1241220 [Fomes fomentarius]|nr:hypothetical protein C8Q74DRAFT_1241220 [Fomes fomentarius]